MPSVSQKQHDLMVAVSKDKELAEKLNIDQKVAKEFVKKDEEEGLWQDAPDLDLEALTLESEDLIPEEARNSAKTPFRIDDRFG